MQPVRSMAIAGAVRKAKSDDKGVAALTMHAVSRRLDPTRLTRSMKRTIMLIADSIFMPLVLWCAIAIRTGEWSSPDGVAKWMFPIAVFISVPVFVRLGLYRTIVRYAGTQVVYTVAKAVTLSVILLAMVTLAVHPVGVPKSALFVYWALAILYIGGSRLAMRAYFQMLAQVQRPKDPVIIYGAGASGIQLALALRRGIEYNPVAFIDDRSSINGSQVDGIRVLDPNALPSLIEKHGVKRILLAMPSISRARRREILARLEPLPVHVMTVPQIGDLVSGVAQVSEVREVAIEDLLGRDPVAPDLSLLTRCVCDKSVMVTGAGGSIGSELCRQIARLKPRCLVVVDHSEFQLYRVEQLLRSDIEVIESEIPIFPILGSVVDGKRIETAMRSFDVQTVYHAAAYKHVPIVEHNVSEGIKTNVLGTWRTAQAAMSAGVETFIFISTDKAVRPTNVMGASKRFAELVLQALAQTQRTTRFSMVRFGNVLGSSGSVVPLFRDQIRRGGPVTVTHPDIIRYFMTIPEAVQLVIQAGSMGRGGDVFVLNMGEPVRIVDLASRMIRLMGLEVKADDQPDGDIDIQFTGLRPGEKLYEELLIGDSVTGTDHPMIMCAEEALIDWDDLRVWLERLKEAAEVNDCARIRSILEQTVNGYKPAAQIVDMLSDGETVMPAHEAAAGDGKIAQFPVIASRGRPPMH